MFSRSLKTRTNGSESRFQVGHRLGTGSRRVRASAMAASLLAIGLAVGTTSAASSVLPFQGAGTIGPVVTGNLTCMVSGPYAWIQITSPMVVATDTSFVGSKFQMVEAMTYVQEWTAKYGWSYVPNTLEGWGAQGTQSNSVFEFPTTNSLYLARGTATQPRYYRVIYRAIWHPGALWLPLPVGGADTYDTTKVLGWGDFVSQPNDYSSGVGYCSF